MKVRKDDMAFTVTAPGVLREIRTAANVRATPISKIEIEPKFHETTALWDTGATNTAIGGSLAQSMGLVPVGKADVGGAHGTRTVNVYLIDVVLPNKLDFGALRATEAVLEDPLGLLIGMDINTRGDLVLTNVNGKTVFSFRWPSRGPAINFVSEINRLGSRSKNSGKKPKHGRKRR